MLSLNCDGCDYCCTRLTWEAGSRVHGIVVFPDEVQYFPEWAIFPLFKNGDTVFAYQIGVHICPALKDGLCSIYPSRPLICKAFPVWNESQKGLVVARGRCLKLAENGDEELDYQSFGPAFDAAREKAEREAAWPKATAMFDLKTKSWVELA